MPSKRTPAANIAFGGVLAALAVVIMSMGTIIPVATYVCPMLASLVLELVRKTCGIALSARLSQFGIGSPDSCALYDCKRRVEDQAHSALG